MASGQSITITINAENKAGPTIQEVKADFKGLAEEIAKAMDEANERTEKSGSKLSGILKSVLGGVVGVVSGIASTIGGIFSGVVSLAGSILSGIVDVVKGVVGGVISAFKLLPDALGLVFNKVTAVAGAALGFVVLKLGEAAAKSEAMGAALDRLAKRAGTSSNAIVAAIKRGSGETITRLDAMRVANQALIAQLDLTPAKFEQLAAVADLLADAVGGDTAEAFESLVQAVRAGNDRLLESVGINIEAEAAYAAYAESLKKSTSDLSEAEKSQALLNAVLVEGSRLLHDAEGSADLLGDAYDRITVLLRDGFTAAADAARGGLLSVAQAIEPILVATKAWIDVNQELITSKVGEFAEGLAGAISRFANRLPEIVDIVGTVLTKAFDLAARAGKIAWEVITDAIGGAIREFEIFRAAFVGLMEGRGFSAEGSVLLQTFRVIRTQAKVLAIDVAQAFTETFADSALAIANFVRDVENGLATLRAVSIAARQVKESFVEGVTNPFDDPLDPTSTRGQGIARRQRELEAASALKPKVTRDSLDAGLEASRAQAQNDADTELLRLGFALEEVSKRGESVRQAASDGVAKLTGAVTEFFQTDEERAAAQLQATEDANASAVGAMQAAVRVTSAVIEEQRRARAEYERARAAFEEMLRQRYGGSPDLGGVPSIAAGG